MGSFELQWSIRADTRALPSIIMPQGTYLIVHFATGTNDNTFTNGMRNYNTGDPARVNLFNDSSDEMALYSPAGIVDFVAWNNGASGYFPEAAHNDAVASGQWTAGPLMNYPADRYALIVSATVEAASRQQRPVPSIVRRMSQAALVAAILVSDTASGYVGPGNAASPSTSRIAMLASK